MVAPPMIDMPQLIDNGGGVSDGDRGGVAQQATRRKTASPKSIL